jgi:hypothetical protein
MAANSQLQSESLMNPSAVVKSSVGGFSVSGQRAKTAPEPGLTRFPAHA